MSPQNGPCPYCGTSTGTHWPDCPTHSAVLSTSSWDQNSRLAKEKDLETAFIRGFECALKIVDGSDLNIANIALNAVKEALNVRK